MFICIVTSHYLPTHRNTSFAYATQSPWLFNDSLKANVLFGRPSWSPRRYQRVLTACDLKKDIELLGPDGDRTVIGEQGSMLSGGQRQRVAVARALYSNANCVILVSTWDWICREREVGFSWINITPFCKDQCMFFSLFNRTVAQFLQDLTFSFCGVEIGQS